MKLTKAQERAKAKLTLRWQCAYELEESRQTLNSLVVRKVALMKRDSVGACFFPRNAIWFKLNREPHHDDII